MISNPDDLNLYLNKRFRSSGFLLEVWELVESELLYTIGMIEKAIITIYIDNDSILLVVATEEHDVLCSVIRKFSIDHVLTTMTELSITVGVNFNISTINKIEYKKSSFYFEKNNREDDGTVDIECDCFYDIVSYDDFKLEIISTIVEELQFLLHRNVLNSDIENCNIANTDAKFEIINLYCQIKNKSFDKGIKEYLRLNKINDNEASSLEALMRKINNEV